MTHERANFNQDYHKLHQRSFTDRELDILSCIISGRTSRKSIASTLNISTATVASYMRGIMQKLECSSWEHIRTYIESEGMVEFLREHFKNHIFSNTSNVKTKQRFPYIKTQETSQDLLQSTISKKISHLWRYHTPKRWFIVLILITSIILILWNMFKMDLHHIRCEFLLPEKQYLLARNRLTNQIKQALFKNHQDNNKIPVVTLVGIGGAGKTTVARMIAQQHTGLTWEINAENKTALIASFRKLAYYSATNKEDKERIEFIQRIPFSIEQELQLGLFIKDKLRSNPGWLLIYDNIESLDGLQEFFPFESKIWGAGSVIVTTRNDNLKVGIQIKIPELNQEESLKLFCMTTHCLKLLKATEKQELSKFIHNLPPYPLDISIAGHYLYVTNTSREEYLRKFYQRTQKLDFQKALIDEYKYTQTRDDILNLTLTRLLKENAHYLGLLVVIGNLDSQNIPIELCESFDNREIVQDFIRQLKKASIISVSSKHHDKKQNIFIHRTIQTYILEWLRNNDLVRKQVLNQQISRLVCLLEKTIHDYIRVENYDRQLEVFPHIKKVLTIPELSEYDKSILSAAYGCMLTNLEQQSILDIDKMKNYVNQLHTESTSYRYLLTLSYYGCLLCNYGRYMEALSILEKCIDLLYKNYPGSIEYYRTLRILGTLYRIIGRYREAQLCFSHCTKVYELFPNKNREKAEIIAQMGLMCRDTGKYIEAQKLLKESVSIITMNNSYLERVLQPYFWLHTVYLELGYHIENINSFDSFNTTQLGILIQNEKHQIGYTGVCAYHLGNYEKALEILESTYKADLKSGYIQNYNSFKGYLPILGKTYIHFKRYKEARTVLEICLSYAEQLYRKNEFQNARILCYLGDLEFAEGHLDLAENKMIQAYQLLQNVDHTDVYIPLESLANLYKLKIENAKRTQNRRAQEEHYEKYKKYLVAADKIIRERFPNDSDHAKRISKKLYELNTQQTQSE